MSFDGGFANPQPGSNLFVARILINQTRDLFLARRELIDGTLRLPVDNTLPVFSQNPNFFEQAGYNLSPRPKFSPLYDDNCFFQQGRTNGFLAVPPGTESEGRDLFGDPRSIGEDNDPRRDISRKARAVEYEEGKMGQAGFNFQ
jgi:hypothetical protein